MRKQTKLVAVLSAAALLAMGASMTSFAAGWERDDAGIWHYYDRDDELVTGAWQKDGDYFFYLDDDGEMLTNSWVDDEYYVDANGRMLVNSWVKTFMDEDMSDPDDGEHWYYFGSRGRKLTDTSRRINGRTYYFNEDGEMRTGWYSPDGDTAYYLGTEDEGWRAQNQWLWLEKSGLNEDEDDVEAVLGCLEDDECDDEGWYWFQSSGQVYNGSNRKRINGRYYLFNQHGQMLYEWINGNAVARSSNAQLDGLATNGEATSISDMRYYNAVEEGWRADGWYEMEGSQDVGTDNDTDWYYVDGGEIEHADERDFGLIDEAGAGDRIYIKRVRINGRYFAFNEKGQMQTGLEYVGADGGFYYFDENGYQRTGRVTNVENDDDDYTYYFNTSNGRNGQGYNGLNSDYLYFGGKRLEANDDFRLYFYDGEIYLVNNRGRVQRSASRRYDIENRYIAGEDATVEFTGRTVQKVTINGEEYDKAQLLDMMVDRYRDDVTADLPVSIPFIQLYDDSIFSYDVTAANEEFDNLIAHWITDSAE